MLLTHLILQHFILGHARTIDKFLSDPKATYYDIVIKDKILFFDEDNSDPDWKVRQCYLLIIASATKIVSGIENLWFLGPSSGGHTYPDFGQYMPINYFKGFCSAAPFCWSEEKYWYEDEHDVPWDVFLPCLASFNNKQQRFLNTVLMLVDESMSGWHPKTTKLGGLPNYKFEPHKHIPLGTMFQNGVECVSGILVAQDVVQNPEKQASKAYFGEKSGLPDGSEITAHTAEVLHLVEGDNIHKGGWVGGDSWFGSTMTAVEVMTKFGVPSSWIIK
jgi:hypothetical protein